MLTKICASCNKEFEPFLGYEWTKLCYPCYLKRKAEREQISQRAKVAKEQTKLEVLSKENAELARRNRLLELEMENQLLRSKVKELSEQVFLFNSENKGLKKENESLKSQLSAKVDTSNFTPINSVEDLDKVIEEFNSAHPA